MHKIAITLAVSVLLFTGAAQAADLGGNIGLGAAAGLNAALGPSYFAQDADPDLSIGFWVKNGFTDRFALGFSYDSMYFNRADLRLQPQMLTAFYQLNPRSRYNPNIHLGTGIVLVGSADTHNRESFGLTTGAGGDLFVGEHLSVGLSAEYLFVAARSEASHENLHVGTLSFKIGFWPVSVTEDTPAPAAKTAPLGPTDPEAQFNMGLGYYTSTGSAKNVPEAVEWFKRSAEQGYPPAQLYLGMIYSNNNDNAQNMPEAVKWLQKAAEKGYPKAQYNLGVMYNNGAGVEKDYASAYKWFSLAAQKGKPEAASARDSAGSMLTAEKRAEIDEAIKNISARQ